MRKIEREMLAAVTSGRTCSLGNTAVASYANVWCVTLHGHAIARGVWSGDKTTVEINLCGYNTVTTRSRLSALIRGLAASEGGASYPSGLGVSSRKGVIRLHDARGETIIDAHGWHKVHF